MPTTPQDQATASPTDRSAQPATDTDGVRRTPDTDESIWIRVEPDSSRRSGGDQPMHASLAEIRSELDGLDLEVVALAPDASAESRRLQLIVDRYERLLDGESRSVADSDSTVRSSEDRTLPTRLLDRLRSLLDRRRR